MVLHYEIDLFYDNLAAVCGCSKYIRLSNNPQCVIVSHYINDQLPKLNNLLPIAIKNLIGYIKDTHKNASICSIFYKLEGTSTKFHPKLTNVSPFVESMESSSDTKYNINASQNISTRRSTKLYELRENVQVHT